MKVRILLGLAFSVLAANVFAADGAERLKQFQSAQFSSQQAAQDQLASDGADHLKAYQTAERGALSIDLKTTDAVADVRNEFGSQYQRY